MHANAERLLRHGFRQHLIPNEDELAAGASLRANYGDHFVDSLATVPGSASYLPALIPNDDSWLTSLQSLMRASWLGLIADFWTQLLIGKRDSKEKPLYLFWDDDVPKPSRLTSLAWLLICEAWPMPNHRLDSDVLFPPQPFMLPQSTPYGFTGASPLAFAEGETLITGYKSIASSFIDSLHRGDRENMAKCLESTVIYRPSVQIATALGFHLAKDFEARYAISNRWSGRSHARIYDQGLASWEITESISHLRALASLRQLVLSGVLTRPGIPTHPNALHQPAGMTIRNWSENGIAVASATTPDAQPWTPDDNAIKLEHGVTLPRIPMITPRVWVGFSHIGPDFEKEGDSIHTASERWAETYLAHRDWAVRMLFAPDSIDVQALRDEAASARAKRLERANRLKKTSGAGVASGGGRFAAAFASIMKQTGDKGE